MSRSNSGWTWGRPTTYSTGQDRSSRRRRSEAPSPERSDTNNVFYTPRTQRNSRPIESPYNDRDMSMLSDSFSNLWTDSMSRYPVHQDGLYDASTRSARYVDRRLHGSDLYATRGNLGNSSMLTSAYSPPAYRTDRHTRASSVRRNPTYETTSRHSSVVDLPNFSGSSYQNPSPAWYTSRTNTTTPARDRYRSVSPNRTRTDHRVRSPPPSSHRSTRNALSSTSRRPNIRDSRGFGWSEH